jgi:hypothetical protein
MIGEEMRIWKEMVTVVFCTVPVYALRFQGKLTVCQQTGDAILKLS